MNRPPLPKIRDRIERPFNEKYKETMEVIAHHLEEFKLGEMPVAWSGGKDSTLLLYLVQTLEPKIPVVFGNTGVEAPETIKFIRRITEEWGIELTELTYYKKNFWECVKEYGLPKGKSHTGKGRGWDRCCWYLKEMPMIHAIREHKWKAILLGTTAMESHNRQMKASTHGVCYHAKKWGVCKVHPLLWWTEAEVWDFILEWELPVNPIYEMGMDRCGCLPCTAYKKWQESLSKVNPKMYRLIMKKMGQSLITEET
jgi:3'-phosphoadenosine 5'-phosphosulfate sulfotransferase (PAPS reductase)/FAD synthetase